MYVKHSGHGLVKNERPSNNGRIQSKKLLFLHPCQLGWSPMPIPVFNGGFPGRKARVVTVPLNK
jgi:hypothetical protein